MCETSGTHCDLGKDGACTTNVAHWVLENDVLSVSGLRKAKYV